MKDVIMRDVIEDILRPNFTKALEEVVGEDQPVPDYSLAPIMLVTQDGSDSVLGAGFFLLRPAVAVNDHIAQQGTIPDPYLETKYLVIIIREAYRRLNDQYRKEVAGGLKAGKGIPQS